MQLNLNLSQYLELIGSSLSLLFNLVLLVIIIKFSRPEYGSYKLLMMVMATLYAIYSAIEVIILPSYLVFEYNYLLYTTQFVEYQLLSQILIVTFCSIFACMQVVLSTQFIYRYLSVASFHFLRERYFKGKRHVVWISLTSIFFTNWFLVAWFVYGNHGVYPKELEEEMFEKFDRNISQMAFTLVSYAKQGENGKVLPNYLNIAMIVYLLACAMIPMNISLSCGIKTWLKIRSTINMAQKSRHLQKQERQLFFALLIQFTIPFIGNTVPMLILFFCPALHISTEPYTNYICMPVPFYPIFDALATTFVIKDYYRGIMRIFGLSRYIKESSTATGIRVPANTLGEQSSVSINLRQINTIRVDNW
ncbi:Seven TM Receptor [Caenorhabditis elegans]|uniref:Seven TM Receptor n=1 Tax=Caenorhabditis elegans TaxID=6239 RepID=O44660_CAEEL|nr:Seven TM Receptor [Caenorhabditis elegans]CCD61358.1 Seven TM Receptor [Caenorhabditis elegans]|eukprot:NP_504105.2 Seven TM Receptor [Caenorhabditis elegans]